MSIQSEIIDQIAAREGVRPWVIRQELTPAQPRVFPCVIHGRQFDTESEYLEELHEFLAGQ
ncbi:hypothetical protein N8654_02210 [Synechococcus sp. AH-601-B19]|nr:hypothetical protein [Synechococcus sp. AH-601-B19]